MKTQYVKSGSYQIAYKILGDKGPALILVNGWISNVEECWSLQGLGSWLHKLSQFGKLVIFDKAGVGLSDRVDGESLPSIRERIEDISAIMQKEKIAKAYLIGYSEGGAIAALFAHTYPQQVEGLILFGSFGCLVKKENNPYGIDFDIQCKSFEEIAENWGQPIGMKLLAPSMANDLDYRERWASFMRRSASPKAAKALFKMVLEIDIEDILPEIKVPTLVLHRTGDRLIPFGLGQKLAKKIPNAKLVALEGRDHFFWLGKQELIFEEISAFISPVEYQSVKNHKIIIVVHGKIEQNCFGLNKFFLDRDKELSCYIFDSVSDSKGFLDMVGISSVLLLHICLLEINDLQFDIKNAKVQNLLQVVRQIGRKTAYISDEALVFFNSGNIHVQSEVLKIQTDLKHYRLFEFSWFSIAGQELRSLIVPGKLFLNDLETLIKVKDYLDENFLEEINLESLSRQFGINLFKLKFGFKRLVGIPIGQYILGLRINHAGMLLAETDLAVNEIGYRLGYQQPANFTKVFKLKTGMTPLEYRKAETRVQLLMVS